MRLPIIALATALLVSILPASTDAQTGNGILDIWLKVRESADAPNDQKVTLYQKSKALVIGMDHYSGGWPQLSNGIKDAEEVAKGLAAQGFEVTFKKDLKSRDLDDTLRDFFIVDGDDPNARLLLWFAGHGDTIDGEAYLVPTDAPSPKADAEFRLKAISLRRFGEYMREAKARHVLAIFDSCFSGGVFNVARSSPPPAITLATTQPVREFISSGEAEQQVSDDGTFRKLFLDVLAGKEPDADANHDGYVTGTELGLFLQQKVTNLTNKRQTPRYGKLNEYGYDRGDFVFQIGKLDVPATAPAPTQPTSEAAQVWASIKDATSLAEIDAFIEQYGATIYGPFARARRDELKTQQMAVAVPAPSADTANKVAISKSDAINLFIPFAKVVEDIKKFYVEPTDEQKLLYDSLQGMLKAFPFAQRLAFAGTVRRPLSSISVVDNNKLDLDVVYSAAVEILNDRSTSVDQARVLQAAFDGMFGGLDPHSAYMDSKSFHDMQVQTRGEFGGLGIEITIEDGLVKVVAPIDDTPAAKAGIRGGDVITHLDDDAVRGLSLNQVVGKMRGPVNTKVRLRVIRKEQDKPLELTVTRDLIRVRPVRSEPIEDIGYIRITQFNEQTNEALKNAISDLQSHIAQDWLKGYVLDLRNNPGGLLDQAISVCDAFLERGEIASTRGRDPQNIQRYNAHPGDLTGGKPLIVLINGGSASASEIVAGALQDHKRATLVGTRSFGKGTVQTIIPLGTGYGALRLTTALYVRPSGRSFQAEGITPDIEVLQDTPEDAKSGDGQKSESSLTGHLKAVGHEATGSQTYVPADKKDDKALRAALDLLHQHKRSGLR